MMTLSPTESRVLGVLVEKAQTTPAQYPLTLNAVVSGCNQKSNRHPVLNLTDEQALEALDGLKAKGLAREVMLTGSRVEKFRHLAREGLEIDTPPLVVLAELLLRGPQTVGELRGRCSRMHPLESIEVVESVLSALAERSPPLVRKLPPPPGGRAPCFVQLLCEDLHPAPAAAAPGSASIGDSPAPERLAALESQVEDLRRAVEQLALKVGEPDLLRTTGHVS